MAIPGIIENNHNWITVTDPDTIPQPPRGILTWIRKTSYPDPHTIKRTSFLHPEVTDIADTTVANIKTIATSRTVSESYLGDPTTTVRALVATLYRQLDAMLTVDSALIEHNDIVSTHHDLDNASTLINQMTQVVDENFHHNVEQPAIRIQELTDQIKLLDLHIQMPQMVADLHTNPTVALETVTHQISALCDLPLN